MEVKLYSKVLVQMFLVMQQEVYGLCGHKMQWLTQSVHFPPTTIGLDPEILSREGSTLYSQI